MIGPGDDERGAGTSSGVTPLGETSSDENSAGDLWLFAYGSLLWDPGFRFAEAVPAVLDGYRRAFCIASIVYRGTPDVPGLVLGLEPGGSCEGRLYRVEAGFCDQTLAYLRGREQVRNVYREAWLPVRRTDRVPPETVRAFVLLADRTHAQYRGGLDPDDAAQMIFRAAGPRGSCRAYLLSTHDHLVEAGIRDAHIADLVARVETLSSRAERG